MMMLSEPSPAPMVCGRLDEGLGAALASTDGGAEAGGAEGLGVAAPAQAETTRPNAARTPSGARVFMVLLLVPSAGDGKIVLPLPYEPDSLALSRKRLHGGGRQILLGDDELSARVEGHDVARIGAKVDHTSD